MDRYMDNNKTLIVIGIMALVFFWSSMWVFSNYPLANSIVSTDKCWTDDNPRELRRDIPYCKGFDDGYTWQRTQSALDCHINEEISNPQEQE